MNLSLYKLRKKLNTDKSGQGSLVAVILASVIGTIIISSTTQWFLSMNKTMDGTDDRLEAMSIAMSEWQRLEHMSLDELEANRENYKTPYNVGDKFTVGVNLGEQGFFDNGTCNALTGNYASESPNCFKDTTMTVYDKDGKAMYTTRSLPLSSQGSNDLPIGTILPYTGDLNKIPHGWFLCDGTNGTPNLINRFLQGNTMVGQFIEAGLPNITGEINDIATTHCGRGVNASGAFKHIDYYKSELAYTMEGGAWRGVTFSAQASNPIYGNSDTVQPSAYTVYYIIRIM